MEVQGLAYLSTTEPNPPKPPDDDDKGRYHNLYYFIAQIGGGLHWLLFLVLPS